MLFLQLWLLKKRKMLTTKPLNVFGFDFFWLYLLKQIQYGTNF